MLLALQREDNSHLNQFIIHAALDMVDEAVWGTQSMQFKSVDKFNDFLISAFVTGASAAERAHSLVPASPRAR